MFTKKQQQGDRITRLSCPLCHCQGEWETGGAEGDSSTRGGRDALHGHTRRWEVQDCDPMSWIQINGLQFNFHDKCVTLKVQINSSAMSRWLKLAKPCSVFSVHKNGQNPRWGRQKKRNRRRTKTKMVPTKRRNKMSRLKNVARNQCGTPLWLMLRSY